MKIHGLDLDNSPLISQDKALRYAQNIAIGGGNQSYINEDGFELKFDIVSKVQEHIQDITNLTIIGTIPINIGVVLFCVSDSIDLIVYIKTDTDEPTIQKILYSDNLKFDVTRPIHGDYIYNYKKELIVTFTEGVDTYANETRVINLTSPYGGQYDTDSTILYNIINVSSLNIIPDVEYPKMTIDVDDGGNLKTGAYQIAISYKLQDGTYTNYSILSVPVIVCGNYGEDYAPNSEINRKIIVSFNKPNISYNTYKLGIVHCNGISQDCYETEDISLENELNTYTISNLNNYNTIVLDDIFIKNISYIREKTLVNYNNRLIRGNVQTLNYQDLNDELKPIAENNITINKQIIPYNVLKTKYITKPNKYFKVGEAYILYVGFFDYKGDLINIYHIPNKTENIAQIPGDLDENNNPKNTGFLITQSEPISDDIEIGLIDELKITNYINNNSQSIYIQNTDDSRYFSSETSVIDDYSITLNNEVESYGEVILSTISNIEDVKHSYRLKFNISCKGGDMVSGDHTVQLDIIDKDSNDILYNTTAVCNYANEGILYVDYAFEINGKSSKNILILLTPHSYRFIRFRYEIQYLDLNTYSPYPIYNLTAKINTTNIPNEVKSVAYFYIEHNTYNSRILSQALCVPDTNVVNFAEDQKYEGQFQGKHALRFYPFEYLYNKISKISAIVNWKYNIGKAIGETSESTGSISFEDLFENETLEATYAVRDTNEANDDFTNQWAKHGIKIIDCDINSIINLDKDNSEKISLEYISNDNTSQQNIAGDSYYRTKDLTIEDYHTDLDNSDANSIYNIDYYITDLINPADNLYSNLDNQKLQIASPIIPITSIENVTLTGDTYLSYLTLRLTTPHKSFVYGNSQFKEGDSNLTVWRWIFTFPIESKYNVTARYSDNIIDKPYFLHDAILQKYTELLGTSYKVDNYINTNVGKGYNPVYNENGIEQFSYYKEIPGTSNHPYRIIRSLAQNPESIALNWRTFKTDDYKDMPFNRGEIISLKTDNKNLYIQQKYGLHLLQQRDQLNSDDANNSYLGTSDLFNMEPKEVVYSPSGYIGCENYFDTNVNVNGYVVIDVVHKKIFMISGDKPLEISNLKTKDFFDKFLSNENGVKRIINYSEDRNILYITQSNSDIEKTMSFSPLNKVWVSFHTYIPDLGFVNRNGLFWGKNGKLYSPTLNRNKGLYIDNRLDDKGNPVPEPSVIQFILNENTIYNKLLKTIVWKDQVSYKGDDYIQHFFKETINHIMVHNFDQCSGELDVAFNNNPKEWWNGDTGTNKINLWRFNKLFDLVTNPDDQFMTDDITPDYTKLKWSNSKPDYKWYDVNRFICQFIYLTMWCDNTPITKQINSNEIKEYHEWELINVHPEWQLDNRNDQTYGNKDNNQ